MRFKFMHAAKKNQKLEKLAQIKNPIPAEVMG
jgi:hypothetical protein